METVRVSVLVVEDDAQARKLLCRLLAQVGYEVHEACDGFEALKRMQELPCEVVVTDYRMPNLNGLELLEIIRDRWPHTPVIVVSGEPAEMAWLVSRQGGYAWIRKPYKPGQILSIVRSAVEQASNMLIAFDSSSVAHSAAPDRIRT